jgi:hypothetical protein
MKIFQIQRTDDLLFSKGGIYSQRWSKKGKNWNGLVAIANHLVQFTKVPDTWIVIEYNIEDDKVSITKTPATQMYAEIKERSRKRNAKQVERRAKEELERLEKRKVELERELKHIHKQLG